MNKIFFLLIFYFFVPVKSEKVNCNGQPRQDIRTKLVHLLEVEPFREFFSEVPHFFMSTIKYKNAIKESQRLGEKEEEKPTLASEMVKLEECGCMRKIQSSRRPLVQTSDSMCSLHSGQRGANQKVISYTYFKNNHTEKRIRMKYFDGIPKILEILPKTYPGWTMRLYHDLDHSDEQHAQLCQMACANPNIDLCHTKNIPALGDVTSMFAKNWRFLPLMDPHVSYFMSRDVDAMIIDREVQAVEEWLQSNKAFHVMHDNHKHHFPMMAGLWGAKLSALERGMALYSFQLAAATSEDMWQNRDQYLLDQEFLAEYIWPWAKHSVLHHAAHHCMDYKDTKPFPTERERTFGNFIGVPWVKNETYYSKRCPVQCRPQHHQDWIFC